MPGKTDTPTKEVLNASATKSTPAKGTPPPKGKENGTEAASTVKTTTTRVTGASSGIKITTEMGSTSMSGFNQGMTQEMTSALLESRDREKKDMQNLNDRLASYIEKVRFLEAQNRKLSEDLDNLRGRWGKDTSSVKQMYETELAEARKLIDDTARNRADVEIQVARLQDEVRDWRQRYEDELNAHDADKERLARYIADLSNAESEINQLKRRCQSLDDETARLRKENSRLIQDLQKARGELDQETLNRIDYQNQVQTLLEEIEFLRRVHEQEIKELQHLAARDSTPENREFFKNELALAIRDIRNEYDQITSQNKTDMESWYKLKVQEIQTSTNKLGTESNYAREETRRLRTQLQDFRGKLGDLEARNALLEKQVYELTHQLEDDQRQYESALNDRDSQIRKMREECQALMMELQMLLDTKQTLDAEILIYRKMLEGEENRDGLRQLVEDAVRTHGTRTTDEKDAKSTVKGEIATRTSFQRSAKGNISIAECDPNGRYIIMENTHRNKEENIGEWKLKRKIDGRREIVFTLPPNVTLPAGKSIKIWARNAGGRNDPPNDLVFEGEDSWGFGNNVQTILYNKEGDERAAHIQRTTQTTA